MDLETTCGHYPHRARGLCQRCYSAAYYAANKERIAATADEWARQNPEARNAIVRRHRAAKGEEYRERNRRYYEANAERIREQTATWREANRDRRRAAQRAAEERRRARKMSSEPDLTNDQWSAILEEFDHRCAYCNRGDLPLEMEHMTPLSRGGRHTASNVVPACGPCNRSKKTRTALEWIGPFHPVAPTR